MAQGFVELGEEEGPDRVFDHRRSGSRVSVFHLFNLSCSGGHDCADQQLLCLFLSSMQSSLTCVLRLAFRKHAEERHGMFALEGVQMCLETGKPYQTLSCLEKQGLGRAPSQGPPSPLSCGRISASSSLTVVMWSGVLPTWDSCHQCTSQSYAQ